MILKPPLHPEDTASVAADQLTPRRRIGEEVDQVLDGIQLKRVYIG